MCVERNYRQKVPQPVLKISRRVGGNARQAGCDEALTIEVKIIFPAAVRPDAKGTNGLALSAVVGTFRLGASAATRNC